MPKKDDSFIPFVPLFAMQVHTACILSRLPLNRQMTKQGNLCRQIFEASVCRMQILSTMNCWMHALAACEITFVFSDRRGTQTLHGRRDWQALSVHRPSGMHTMPRQSTVVQKVLAECLKVYNSTSIPYATSQITRGHVSHTCTNIMANMYCAPV